MARPDIFYLKPNSNWAQANARFTAYFCHDTGDAPVTWVDAVGPNEDGIYSVTYPTEVVDIDETTQEIIKTYTTDYATVIFCRMNPSTKENN